MKTPETVEIVVKPDTVEFVVKPETVDRSKVAINSVEESTEKTKTSSKSRETSLQEKPNQTLIWTNPEYKNSVMDPEPGKSESGAVKQCVLKVSGFLGELGSPNLYLVGCLTWVINFLCLVKVRELLPPKKATLIWVLP